jgi:hypothetical protein
MSRPTVTDVHVNSPLTNISIAFTQEQRRFGADRIFPIVPVDKQSDRYYVYDRGHWNRDDMQERAPGTESAGAGFTIDNTPTYFCREYALHQDVPDQVIANADSVIDPMRDAVQFLATKALIKREKLWVANYFTTSKWTTDLTGVASAPNSSQFLQWNDSSADPIKVVRTAATTVLERTGFQPNVLVLGKRTYDGIVDSPAVIDRVKYGQITGGPAMATVNILAQLFEVDRVEVLSGIENTASEGLTNSHSFIGGKSALLCYSAPVPGLMTPSAGYTFAWRNLGYTGQVVRDFRMDELKATRVEIETNFDQKLISADLGYFFASAVA